MIWIGTLFCETTYYSALKCAMWVINLSLTRHYARLDNDWNHLYFI